MKRAACRTLLRRTLIVEHLAPSGPIREWWTPDDLLTTEPVSLPPYLATPPQEGQLLPLQEYARSCAVRYTHPESGTARLTAVPVPPERLHNPGGYVVVDLGGGWRSAVLLMTGRKLAEKYPQGRVVTLLAWAQQPLLFQGDAEAVFGLHADNEPEGSG